MNLLENNFVINLEKRNDRLEHVKREFEKLGIQLTRFNAVEHKKGAIGCANESHKMFGKSHQLNYEYVFICEDDVTFLDISSFKKN